MLGLGSKQVEARQVSRSPTFGKLENIPSVQATRSKSPLYTRSVTPSSHFQSKVSDNSNADLAVSMNFFH